MNTVCYNVVTGTGDEKCVVLDLENLPSIDNFTEETKGRIALEILKSMKAKGILKIVVYTKEPDTGDDIIVDIV